MDGAHTIEEIATATGRVLQAVYTELYDQRIDLPGTLLKTNMALSGYDAPRRTRSPNGRSSASTATFPRRCPGSSSSGPLQAGPWSNDGAACGTRSDGSRHGRSTVPHMRRAAAVLLLM